MKRSGGVVTKEIKSLAKKIRQTPAPDHYDPNSIRVSYVRYADDWIIGVTGPKSLALDLRERAKKFLLEKLNLTLSMDKTKITNLRKDNVSFLGFNLWIPSPKEAKVTEFVQGNFSMKRRASHGANIKISIPIHTVVNRLREKGFCDENHFPIHHNYLLAQNKDQIVTQYNAVLRGITNYYAACDNFHQLSWVEYILRFSLAKTLANKERTSMRKQFRKRGKYLTVTKEIGDKKMSVRLVEFRDLKRNSFSSIKQDYDRILTCTLFGKNPNLELLNVQLKNVHQGKMWKCIMLSISARWAKRSPVLLNLWPILTVNKYLYVLTVTGKFIMVNMMAWRSIL